MIYAKSTHRNGNTAASVKLSGSKLEVMLELAQIVHTLKAHGDGFLVEQALSDEMQALCHE